MSPQLLGELAHLFFIEAEDAADEERHDDAEHLWSVSDELSDRLFEQMESAAE